MTAATAEQVRREAERAADRLQVVGPRMEARANADADALLAAVRELLQQLADLAADAEGRPRSPVPLLAARALGDQLLVLAHDAAALDPASLEAAAQLLARLRALI